MSSPQNSGPATATSAADSAADGDLNDLPLLFAKPGCPWCEEVVAFLDERGIAYRRIDIDHDAEGRAELERLSRQSKVPTLNWNGDILADFGVEELVPFLRSKNVKLEDS